MNNIVVVSGPSGCGKSSLIRKLMGKHPEIVFSTSHTTRAKRERETQGVEYHFVSREKFRDMIDNNEFVEWAEVYENFYGTSYREIETKARGGKYLLLDLDVQGAKNIKAKFPEALLILIVPPSFEELQRRLVGREKKVDDDVRKRLEIARDELSQYKLYEYVVINDNFSKASYTLDSIYTAYRNLTPRREIYIKNLLVTGTGSYKRPANPTGREDKQ
jgi:guanylate kinase